MDSGDFSPDGKWLWNGSEWIPAPPTSDPPITLSMNPNDEEMPGSPPFHDFDELSDSMGFDPERSTFIPVAPFHSPGGLFATRKRKIIAISVGIIMIIGLSIGSYFLFYVFGDACGNILYVENDDPPGGVIDSTTTYTYDDDYNIIMEDEIGWDGALIGRTTHSYDSDGNEIEEYRTWDDNYDKDSYTYDSDGNMLTWKTENSYTWDDPEMRIYSYDSDGRMMKKETDEGADGSVDSKATYEYNSKGQLQYILTDTDMNGYNDESLTYHYDSDGNNIRTVTDEGMDGTTDGIEISSFDSDGRILENKIDWDNDGRYDVIFIHTYDADGRPTRFVAKFDSEFAFLASEYITTYEYDGNTLIKTIMNRYDSDGELDSTETSYYGCVE